MNNRFITYVAVLVGVVFIVTLSYFTRLDSNIQFCVRHASHHATFEQCLAAFGIEDVNDAGV